MGKTEREREREDAVVKWRKGWKKKSEWREGWVMEDAVMRLRGMKVEGLRIVDGESTAW